MSKSGRIAGCARREDAGPRLGVAPALERRGARRPPTRQAAAVAVGRSVTATDSGQRARARREAPRRPGAGRPGRGRERTSAPTSPAASASTERREVAVEAAPDERRPLEVERRALVAEQPVRERDRERLGEVVGGAHDEAAPARRDRARRPGASTRVMKRAEGRQRVSAGRRRSASGPPRARATWRSSQRATARRSAAVASQRSSALAPVSESVPSSVHVTQRRPGPVARGVPTRRRCAPPDRGRRRAGRSPSVTSRSACADLERRGEGPSRGAIS